MSKILLLLAIIGTMALAGVLVVRIMGDKSCQIQIQNGSERNLYLKTFQYTNYEKKISVDSIALGKNEKIEIGHCINCSVPDTVNIEFDAIGFYIDNQSWTVMEKPALINYLETKRKEGCLIYVVE